MTAGELAGHFQLAKPTLSRHFAVLRHADLIQSSKQGTSITYRLNVSVLEESLIALMNLFQLTGKESKSWGKKEIKAKKSPSSSRA